MTVAMSRGSVTVDRTGGEIHGLQGGVCGA